MYQPGFNGGRHESRGETTASTDGTRSGTGTPVNTKGTWASLGAATSFAYEAITVCIGRSLSAQNGMIDIGIGASNQFVLVENLYFAGAKLAHEQYVFIYVPVHVPLGAQLSTRRSDSVGNLIDVTVIGHEVGLGGAPGFSRCIALFTPALSRGIAVDPGGSANTKGSWAQITSSCPNDIGAMFGLIGYNGDTARAATAISLIDIGIGAAASEFVLYPNALCGWSTVKDGPSNCPRIPLFACDVPSGTRIAARSQCSINTAGDRTIDLALYGLVK